jgi:hypothetical protein
MGTMLMAVSVIQMLVFTIAVMRRSYLAIALPVMLALSAVSALTFWVGYTMVNMGPELAELDLEEEEPAIPQL